MTAQASKPIPLEYQPVRDLREADINPKNKQDYINHAILFYVKAHQGASALTLPG